MTPLNILITSASRKVFLVKSFKEALLKEGGGRVIAADHSPYSAAFFFADKHYVLPEDSSPKFLQTVIKICKDNKVALIIPTRDEELAVFAQHKERFNREGIMVMVSPEKSIEICQDKLKFFEFCRTHHFNSPKVFSPKDLKGQVKFPVFLNGRISKAGKNAFIIYSQEELTLFLKVVKKPIIEEYISAKEYTVDLFADFDGNKSR